MSEIIIIQVLKFLLPVDRPWVQDYNPEIGTEPSVGESNVHLIGIPSRSALTSLNKYLQWLNDSVHLMRIFLKASNPKNYYGNL